MYRVILSSSLKFSNDGSEEQFACEEAYNAAVSSDEIEDMDYGQLVDFVATRAKVQTNVAGYFVDEFMRRELEPIPLRQ
ncbi:MAG: hypothetical protein NC548_53270 [Lachnospiraceae bacterium]|nr:hypothetical protein [Lachnospiraceae bacterium]